MAPPSSGRALRSAPRALLAVLAGLSPTMKHVWNVEEPQARQSERTTLLGNLAPADGALRLPARGGTPWRFAPDLGR